MNWTHILIFIGGAAVGFFGVIAVGVWAKAPAKPAPPEPAPVQPPPRAPGARWQWHALPGNRIELGDTGFYIELKTKPWALDFPYHGYSPEGERIIWGHGLQAMKNHLQQMANDRAEFNADGEGWRP